MIEGLVKEIFEVSSKLKDLKLMSFCGTHEHTIASSGIREIIPRSIELIPGPGCPVCITPAGIIDEAIRLSLEGIEILTFGDAYRLPGFKWTKGGFPRSLMEAKELGGKVKVVYSPAEALHEGSGERVFLAIGFETTVPATVSLLERGKDRVKIISAHRLTPPVMVHTLEKHGKGKISGIIAPGHVSAIIGAKAWEFLPRDYGIPTVVSGFEPEDVLISILGLLRMIEAGRPELLNTYSRVVRAEGNKKALSSMEKWFEVRDASWRGLGMIPKSGLFLKEKWRNYDAEFQYGLRFEDSSEKNLPGCRCAEVVLGMSTPLECPLFMKSCTPERPYGPCMVSLEGTCYIWARNYGKRRRG